MYNINIMTERFMEEIISIIKTGIVVLLATWAIGFVFAVSFWWGTYFSIKMVLDLVSKVFS